jgi:3-hydroxymyristoyl/3-hydroxydecanoyl-(acyl carrier protein) dehydratase
MRFVLVDRILKVEKDQGGLFLKNVTQSEDFCGGCFPGLGVMPGSFILEAFEQAAHLLIAFSRNFAYSPKLRQISNATLKSCARAGDQLKLSLTLGSQEGNRVRVSGRAEANGKVVAEATLEFSLTDGKKDKEAEAHCRRLQSLYDVVSSDPVDRGRGILVFKS